MKNKLINHTMKTVLAATSVLMSAPLVQGASSFTGFNMDFVDIGNAGNAADDTGYDASKPFRNSNAQYFLPSEDEWYKAAYYDPDASAYYDYATGSDTVPLAVANGTTSGTAVYNLNSTTQSPANIMNAGGLSLYGTMAQNGNVSEWGESAIMAPNDVAGEYRLIRGGGWSSIFGDGSNFTLKSSSRLVGNTVGISDKVGFRVAAVTVPEPSGVALLLIGAMGCLMKRKRG